MLNDKQNMFSEDQTLISTETGTTITSTNVINVGDAKKGEGEPIEVLAQITTALTSASSSATLQVKLISSAAEALTSPDVLSDSGALAIANWAAGDQSPIRVLPNGAKQYLAFLYIEAVAPITAGAISSGLVRHIPTNK